MQVCGQILKCSLPKRVHPIILRRGLPDWNHHLIDFFHAGRVVELRLDELYRIPIIEAIRVRVGLLLGNILKEGSDVLCELVLFVLRHGGPIFITQKPPLGDHGAHALFHRIPFQLHLSIGFCHAAVTEMDTFTELIGHIIVAAAVSAVFSVIVL